jgi:hypothetical protein
MVFNGIYNGLMGFYSIQWDINGIYPLVNIQKATWKMVIEIVDSPMNSMVDLSMIFHTYVSLPEGTSSTMKIILNYSYT